MGRKEPIMAKTNNNINVTINNAQAQEVSVMTRTQLIKALGLPKEEAENYTIIGLRKQYELMEDIVDYEVYPVVDDAADVPTPVVVEASIANLDAITVPQVTEIVAQNADNAENFIPTWQQSFAVALYASTRAGKRYAWHKINGNAETIFYSGRKEYAGKKIAGYKTLIDYIVNEKWIEIYCKQRNMRNPGMSPEQIIRGCVESGYLAWGPEKKQTGGAFKGMSHAVVELNVKEIEKVYLATCKYFKNLSLNK